MKLIELTQGYVALVDESDYDRVLAAGPWQAFESTNTVYARAHGYRDGKRVTVLMHRFILGVMDPKIEVDHRNGYGMDNRRSNLRACTKGQNQANRKKLKKASSQYRGVSWRGDLGKWAAYLNHDKKRITIGFYDDEQLAARVYDAVAKWNRGVCTAKFSKEERVSLWLEARQSARSR